VNPFLTLMYKNMSFGSWRKDYELNLTKRIEQQKQGIERSSLVIDSDSDYSEDSEFELVEQCCESDEDVPVEV
jgi:hypothetical protein